MQDLYYVVVIYSLIDIHMNTSLTTIIIIICWLLLVWVGRWWYVSRVEHPLNEILLDSNGIQIRRTSESIYATVTVSGSDTQAPGSAFGILAGYIFGKNTAQDQIAMTAPVVTQPTAEPIAMTAPVISQSSGDNTTDVSFIMPSQYTMQTLPLPQDDRIRITSVASKVIAVISFDGYVSRRSRVDRYRNKLLITLQDMEIPVIGETIIAQYNDPLTPWFMRTNEIWVEIEYK